MLFYIILLVVPVLCVIGVGFSLHMATKQKYNPHLTRRLEVEIYGEARTKCDDANCLECHPKALPLPPKGPAGDLETKKAAILTPNEIREPPRIRKVDGYRVFIPLEVPDNAYAYSDYNHISGIVSVIFQWTDQDTGQRKALKTFPAEQFVPEAEYHEIRSGDGKVVRLETTPSLTEMQLPNPGRISRF